MVEVTRMQPAELLRQPAPPRPQRLRPTRLPRSCRDQLSRRLSGRQRLGHQVAHPPQPGTRIDTGQRPGGGNPPPQQRMPQLPRPPNRRPAHPQQPPRDRPSRDHPLHAHLPHAWQPRDPRQHHPAAMRLLERRPPPLGVEQRLRVPHHFPQPAFGKCRQSPQCVPPRSHPPDMPIPSGKRPVGPVPAPQCLLGQAVRRPLQHPPLLGPGRHPRGCSLTHPAAHRRRGQGTGGTRAGATRTGATRAGNHRRLRSGRYNSPPGSSRSSQVHRGGLKGSPEPQPVRRRGLSRQRQVQRCRWGHPSTRRRHRAEVNRLQVNQRQLGGPGGGARHQHIPGMQVAMPDPRPMQPPHQAPHRLGHLVACLHPLSGRQPPQQPGPIFERDRPRHLAGHQHAFAGRTKPMSPPPRQHFGDRQSPVGQDGGDLRLVLGSGRPHQVLQPVEPAPRVKVLHIHPAPRASDPVDRAMRAPLHHANRVAIGRLPQLVDECRNRPAPLRTGGHSRAAGAPQSCRGPGLPPHVEQSLGQFPSQASRRRRDGLWANITQGHRESHAGKVMRGERVERG